MRQFMGKYYYEMDYDIEHMAEIYASLYTKERRTALDYLASVNKYASRNVAMQVLQKAMEILLADICETSS